MKTSFFILKTRKRGVGALLLALLFGPPAAYAAYLTTVVLLDSLRGDALLGYYFFHESRRDLLTLLVTDAAQALPVFYGVALVVWVEMHFLSRFEGWLGWWLALFAGAVTGYALAAIFVGLSLEAALPALVAGAGLALFLAWALRPIRVPA